MLFIIRASADANANNLARLQDLERGEHIRHESEEIIDSGRASLKDYQRNRLAPQALLMLHISVHRNENFEARLLGCG